MDEERIARAYAEARGHWPGVEVALDTFAQQIRATEDPLHTSDLYLALACAAGDRHALAAFEQRFAAEMTRSLARLRLDPTTADEVAQVVREKLFVTGKIASYSGKGPLGAWLRAMVVHTAVSAHRKEQKHAGESDSLLGEAAASSDPELAQIREKYAAAFKEAFKDAFLALPERDRNVLRLVYAEGLTAEQVGLAYGVHRVSVARWIGQAKEGLLDGTRSLLRDRLSLDPAEFASVTRLCLSQLDVSLDRLLREG
jgi:RNA polymerase sigma-70 factor (ECF subfamily)